MRPFFVLCLAIGLAAVASAQTPPWLAEALDRMPTEIPSGYGYEVEIKRNDESSVERFDPTRPPSGRWILVSRAGRAPTAEELTAYARLRTSGVAADSAYRAAFRIDQLDLTSARILEENNHEASVRLGFSSTAVDSDKMLGRLELTVQVRKAKPAAVLAYRLQLPASYSPVLGVRMHELDAGATFGPDGLPERTWSYFRGRIFLRTVDEKIDTAYRAFVRMAKDQPQLTESGAK